MLTAILTLALLTVAAHIAVTIKIENDKIRDEVEAARARHEFEMSR